MICRFALGITWVALAIALLSPLAGCGGGSGQGAASGALARASWRAPAGARELSYGCAQSGEPSGQGDYASGFIVDLDAGRWAWSFMDGPTTHDEGPLPVPAPALAEMRRLSEEVLANASGWEQEPAVVDGAACSLVIEVSGSKPGRPLASVQRQTQTRGDAPDLLIKQVLALRSRGLQP